MHVSHSMLMSHLHLIHVMKLLREVKTNDSIQTLFALRDQSGHVQPEGVTLSMLVKKSALLQ